MRQAVSLNAFKKVDDSPWPTAQVEERHERGHVQLIPPEAEVNSIAADTKDDLIASVWRQWPHVSDEDADTMDLLSSSWLEQASKRSDLAVVTVDELLSRRGLAPKRGGDGHVGGYRPDQREAIVNSVRRLENLWITLSEHQVYIQEIHQKRAKRQVIAVQSRALLITDRMGPVLPGGGIRPISFRFRPGEIFGRFLFGIGRQVAMLSIKAVQYDPYRQKWEKRLARYLSWQWRIRAAAATYLVPFKVRTLLHAVGVDPERARICSSQARLEKALDKLEEDQVIKGWQYQDFNESDPDQCTPLNGWLGARLVAEPPDVVKDTYRGIFRPNPAERQTIPPTHSLNTGDRVRERRSKLEISQLIAAEQIGISPVTLCQIEKGRRSASRAARSKIERWLGEN